MVVNEKDFGSSEAGKLRACLDATMQNKVLFRGESKMADVTTITIKQRVAKCFISIDCEQMYKMIKVEDNDQKDLCDLDVIDCKEPGRKLELI